MLRTRENMAATLLGCVYAVAFGYIFVKLNSTELDASPLIVLDWVGMFIEISTRRGLGNEEHKRMKMQICSSLQ